MPEVVWEKFIGNDFYYKNGLEIKKKTKQVEHCPSVQIPSFLPEVMKKNALEINLLKKFIAKNLYNKNKLEIKTQVEHVSVCWFHNFFPVVKLDKID